MNSSSRVPESEVALSAIPPVISNNPREKIGPDLIPVGDILRHHKDHASHKSVESLNAVHTEKCIPTPRYLLSIIWSPCLLHFDVENELILKKVRILNVCARSIYIHCCSLWGDSARLGASWRCFPRTRFLLAPGLFAEINVTATPKEHSPVPSAKLSVQIAAAHRKDLVVGYFAIPVMIKFHNYIKPCLGEAE